MDLFAIFAPLFHMLWYLIPIVLLGALFKSPWFKGAMGEFSINQSIKRHLNAETYHLLKNVTLPTESGTTQVDHVIVSIFGIFVLETKNMKGWIFGNAHQKTWTQKIYKHSSKFQNPLHQNYKHVKTLQQLLSLEDHQIHSLVVFVGESKFKTDMPENVTQGRDYLKFIRSKTEVVLSDHEVLKMVAQIEQDRLAPNLKTHFVHVKNVKSNLDEQQKTKRHISVESTTQLSLASDSVSPSIDQPLVEPSFVQKNEVLLTTSTAQTCPKCGNEMVLREPKKGKNVGEVFWGCTQFPKCRAIVSV